MRTFDSIKWNVLPLKKDIRLNIGAGSGVYCILKNSKIIYIGSSFNLKTRVHINHNILSKIKSKRGVTIMYFYTHDYREIEKTLIAEESGGLMNRVSLWKITDCPLVTELRKIAKEKIGVNNTFMAYTPVCIKMKINFSILYSHLNGVSKDAAMTKRIIAEFKKLPNTTSN